MTAGRSLECRLQFAAPLGHHSRSEKLAIGLLGIVGQRSLDNLRWSDFTIQDKQAFFPLSGQTEQPTRVSARIE
jgi:hypothetical protein